jgi:hypothetical protein
VDEGFDENEDGAKYKLENKVPVLPGNIIAIDIKKSVKGDNIAWKDRNLVLKLIFGPVFISIKPLIHRINIFVFP